MLWRDGPDAQRLDFDTWRELFLSACGRYSLERSEPNGFAGWVRPFQTLGFCAMDITCRENRINRRPCDIRRDGVDLYGALFQVAGRSVVSHKGQLMRLAAGDVILIDKARPVSYIADSHGAHWLCLQFPRRTVTSHLGFEPQGGSYKRGGTPAGRLLYEFAINLLSAGRTFPAGAVICTPHQNKYRTKGWPMKDRHQIEPMALKIDVYDGELWTEMDVRDPIAALKFGDTIEDAAQHLCRSGTVEDVRRKPMGDDIQWHVIVKPSSSSWKPFV
jgi:AraC-binding-like domain